MNLGASIKGLLILCPHGNDLGRKWAILDLFTKLHGPLLTKADLICPVEKATCQSQRPKLSPQYEAIAPQEQPATWWPVGS